jgi:hypothetical protein
VVAQLVGAVLGVGLANLMFGLPIFFASHHVRTGLSAVARRVHRDLRPAGRYLGLLSIEADRDTVRRRRVYRRRILVYVVNVVRQPPR